MAYKTRPGESQFQARQRIAREKGFGSYSQYRRAPVNDRLAATRRLQTRDAGYRRSSKGAERVIQTRSKQRAVSAGGIVLTTTNMRRHRAFAAEADRVGLAVKYTVVVALGGVDRRRRDPRRRRGRDTGYRTLRFTVWPGDLDTSTLDDFVEDFDDALDDALDALYPGGQGYAVESVTAVA